MTSRISSLISGLFEIAAKKGEGQTAKNIGEQVADTFGLATREDVTGLNQKVTALQEDARETKSKLDILLQGMNKLLEERQDESNKTESKQPQPSKKHKMKVKPGEIVEKNIDVASLRARWDDLEVKPLVSKLNPAFFDRDGLEIIQDLIENDFYLVRVKEGDDGTEETLRISPIELKVFTKDLITSPNKGVYDSIGGSPGRWYLHHIRPGGIGINVTTKDGCIWFRKSVPISGEVSDEDLRTHVSVKNTLDISKDEFNGAPINDPKFFLEIEAKVGGSRPRPKSSIIGF